MWNKHLFQTRKDSGQKFPYGDDVTPCIGIEPVRDAGVDNGGSYQYGLYQNYAWIKYYNNTSSTSVVIPDYINGYKTMFDRNIAFSFGSAGVFEVGMLSPASGCTEAMIGCEVKQRLYTLKGFFSSSSLATIQEDFIGNNVKDLSSAFDFCTRLINPPTIPNGVVNMHQTFLYDTNLASAPDIPDSVVDLSSCFESCSNITLPPNIGNGVVNMCETFGNCPKLISGPTIPPSVRDMSSCFYLCNNLSTPPIISEGVTNLHTAFRCCYNLKTFPQIPSTATDLTNAFAACEVLTATNAVNLYTLPSTINTLDGTFCYSYFVKTPDIPPHITNIPNCFSTGWNLTTIGNIPDTVVNMSYTFNNCRYLTTQAPFPNNVIDASGCYSNCYNLTSVVLPNNATNIAYIYNYCRKVTNSSISVPDSVIDMTYAFNGCSNITGISKLGNSIQNMSYAFYDTGIRNNVPNIPNSVTDMSYTFGSCYNLTTSPTIGNSVVNMYGTFYYCSNLTSTPIIPDSVKDMSRTYQYCNSLTVAGHIGNNVENTVQTFMHCRNLTTGPNIPNSVINMSGMFTNCRNLTTVANIPNSVIDMSNAFLNCKNLKTPPTIGANVINMAYAFNNCSNLSVLPTLPNKVENIYEIFAYCTTVTAGINIPDSVTNASYAYDQCNKMLTPGTIGNNVKNMTGTYYYCTNLTQPPTLPDGVENLCSTFYQCTALTSAPIIPASVTNLYRTFRYCNKLTGDIYIYSNKVSYATDCFANAYSPKNVYVYPGTVTHNTLSSIYNNGQCGVTIKFIGYATVTFASNSGSYVKVNNEQVTQTYWPYNSTQSYTLYKKNCAPYITTVTLGSDENVTVNIDNVTPDPAPYTITYNITPSNATITSVIDGFIVEGNSCYGYDGAVINYTISCDGYRTIRGSTTVTGNATITETLDPSALRSVSLAYPFTNNTEDTATLIDGSNFVIDSATSSIMSGSTSYNKNNGTSYGYLVIDAAEDTTLTVTCSVSSESNYDWGVVYVGSAVYRPTATNVKQQATDGNGYYLYRQSGSKSSETVTATLTAGSVYYVTFMYVKDGSGNSYNDRFYITNIDYETRR